jgi:hypothetical protein
VKPPALFLAVLLAASTAGAATAADRVYAGYVLDVDPDDGAAVRVDSGRESRLSRGNRLLEGDCIRVTKAGGTILVELDSGLRDTLHFQGDSCRTMRPAVAGQGIVGRLLDIVLKPLRPEPVAPRRGAQWRSWHADFVGLGRSGTALLPSGPRSLYVNWCTRGPQIVRLYDPQGRLKSSAHVSADRSGATLPEVTLTPGPWRLQFMAPGHPEAPRQFWLQVVDGPASPLLSLKRSTTVERLVAAAEATAERPDGKLDFAVLQILAQEQDERIRDGLAEDNFCPR